VRPIFKTEPRRLAVVVLALVLTVPLLNGCSTLGIATTKDLTATESRLQDSNRANSTRLDNLEKNTADMQQTLTEITTSLDTLNTRFVRAKAWLEHMSLDTISADAKAATEAATLAESRSRMFLENYVEWLKAQYALLGKQIDELDAKMKEGPKGAPTSTDSGKAPEKPEESSSQQ
jgi:uncharacterized phage infection (PIP) family protein YhgE